MLPTVKLAMQRHESQAGTSIGFSVLSDISTRVGLVSIGVVNSNSTLKEEFFSSELILKRRLWPAVLLTRCVVGIKSSHSYSSGAHVYWAS